MAKASSDRYIRMYGPILDALREVGGEAPAREIAALVADQVLGDTEERHRDLPSGGNAAENEVAWARNNLREAGFIDGSTRGIWRLSPKGWKSILTIEDARKIGRHRQIVLRNAPEKGPLDEDASSIPIDEIEPDAPRLIEAIKQLPPKGFERLCQRILREAGFSDVEVTGRSGDGGIDGIGVLQVNELVSFRVLFQCKRIQGSVGSSDIRNFRGAMGGRTDKGIFLTTGTFTSEAQKEASRDGVSPIELIDADKLVSLMERLQLGVRPRTVFDVDDEFFEPFRGDS